MKVPTMSMCEIAFNDAVNEDKQCLFNDYGEDFVEGNFEYNHRIDELDGLLHINKRRSADQSLKNSILISSRIWKIIQASSTLSSYI